MAARMKPRDGGHRSYDPHREWCKNLFNSLADGGTWGVPRTLLTFRKRGQQLVLVERGDYPSARDQQEDFQLIQEQFASAGIEVIDET
jgi:hypothetical protein